MLVLYVAKLYTKNKHQNSLRGVRGIQEKKKITKGHLIFLYNTFFGLQQRSTVPLTRTFRQGF